MAIEEMFTSLPTVSSSTMSDIICAVQGYTSPSNLGLSTQQTLQQVYNLFQSNVILFNAGNPNGSVAGNTYQLCWDTTNTILYVCTTSGTSSTAVWTKSITLTAGTGISISQAGNTITISVTGETNWVDQTTTTVTMVAGTGYTADAGASLITFTLPTTSAVGDFVEINGKGSGLYTIAQAAGQQINFVEVPSTLGAGGSVSSNSQHCAIRLRCLTANTIWEVVYSTGFFTVV